LSEALEVTTDYLVGRTRESAAPAAADEPLLRDFAQLSEDERELARKLIAQMAQHSRQGRE
jgi:hypothetical protein